MITESTIYWITRLTGINIGLILFGVLFGAFGIICTIAWHVDWMDNRQREIFRKHVKHPVLIGVLGVVLLVSAIFVPTTKQACAILIIPKIVNNEQLQEIPQKLLGLADEWVDELSPNRNENTSTK